MSPGLMGRKDRSSGLQVGQGQKQRATLNHNRAAGSAAASAGGQHHCTPMQGVTAFKSGDRHCSCAAGAPPCNSRPVLLP